MARPEGREGGLTKLSTYGLLSGSSEKRLCAKSDETGGRLFGLFNCRSFASFVVVYWRRVGLYGFLDLDVGMCCDWLRIVDSCLT